MAVFVRIAKKCLTFDKIRSKSSCHIPFTHALITLDSIEAYLDYGKQCKLFKNGMNA